MAPRLKLPDNFRVKTFSCSRNSCRVGEFVAPNGEGIHAGDFAHVIDLTSTIEDPSLVLETCLSDSVVILVTWQSPSEATVVSPEGCKGNVVSKQRGKRKAAPIVASCAWKRRKTATSTITQRWQAVWACKYTWVKGEFDSNGNLSGVVCVSCTTISGRRKVIVLKGDNLDKHEGKRTCLEDGVSFPDLKKGDSFSKLDRKHMKFVKLWAGHKRSASVADQLAAGLEGEAKRKGVQFSTLFQVLTHGRPMCDYECEQYLLHHLKVKNLPRKHWFESSGWDMSEHFHVVVLKVLKDLVQSAYIVSISADEVTIIDSTSWLGVHVYTMKSWKRVRHLLHLSCLSEGGIVDILTNG